MECYIAPHELFPNNIFLLLVKNFTGPQDCRHSLVHEIGEHLRHAFPADDGAIVYDIARLAL